MYKLLLPECIVAAWFWKMFLGKKEESGRVCVGKLEGVFCLFNENLKKQNILVKIVFVLFLQQSSSL